MPLESIIHEYTLLREENFKECKEFDEIILILKKLRGNCTEESVSKGITEIKALIPKIPFSKGEMEIINEGMKNLNHILIETQRIDRCSKKTFPKSIREFRAKFLIPTLDYIYRETEKRFPGCLYLPVCQGFLTDLGDSEGVCYGFATEGIRGLLETGKLFGHPYGDRPIFRPIVSSKQTKSRTLIGLNNTVFFNPNVFRFQDGKSGEIIMGVKETLIAREKLNPANIIRKIAEQLNAKKEPQGFNLFLEKSDSDEDGHAIGLVCDSKKRLVVIDANSGCYVFKDILQCVQWFKWYIDTVGFYGNIFDRVSYNAVILDESNAENLITLKMKKTKLEIIRLEKEHELLKLELDKLQKLYEKQGKESQKLFAEINLIEDKYIQFERFKSLTEQILENQNNQRETAHKMVELQTLRMTECLNKQTMCHTEISRLANKVLRNVELQQRIEDSYERMLQPKNRCAKVTGKAKDYINLGLLTFKCAYRHVRTQGPLSYGPTLREDLEASLQEIERRPVTRGLNLETTTLRGKCDRRPIKY